MTHALPSVAERILGLLEHHGLPHRVIEHDEARTAVEAAAARGTPLAAGGKSLVMKLDRDIGFAVLAVGGDQRIDNRALRQHLGLRRYRFATRDELAERTGLKPGSVPPFGRPVFDLPLYVDAALAAGPRVAFSLGSPTRSVVMATEDWLVAAQPVEVFAFVR